MADFLTDYGEEYVIEFDLNVNDVTFGLFNQSTDGLTESSNLAAITTEPTSANYGRQTSGVTSQVIGSDFGIVNDVLVSFDVSDITTTEVVDHSFWVVNFQSSVAGDGSPVDNLIGIAALTQSRDLSQVDTVEFAAGNLQLSIT